MFSTIKKLTPVIKSLVLKQSRQQVKLAWFSSDGFLISHMAAEQPSLPINTSDAQSVLLIWTSRIQHSPVKMEKIFIIYKKGPFMGCIYLLMMKNILNLMFYWIHEFLSWEDHTQALWYKTLCTISQGQKYVQATHKIEVRLMISNI